LFLSGNQTPLPAPDEAVAVSCHKVVNGISKDAWDNSHQGHESPRTTQITSDAQSCSRADEGPLCIVLARRLDPDHGVHVAKVRMAPHDSATEGTINRSEAKNALAIPSKDELHAFGAEAARTVIEEYRPGRSTH
jgi:hypothetical protein